MCFSSKCSKLMSVYGLKISRAAMSLLLEQVRPLLSELDNASLLEFRELVGKEWRRRQAGRARAVLALDKSDRPAEMSARQLRTAIFVFCTVLKWSSPDIPRISKWNTEVQFAAPGGATI